MTDPRPCAAPAPVTLWTVVRAALAEHQAIEDDRDADHGGCSCDAYRYTDHTINRITGERHAHPGTATPEDYHAARAWFLDHQTNAVVATIEPLIREKIAREISGASIDYLPGESAGMRIAARIVRKGQA